MLLVKSMFYYLLLNMFKDLIGLYEDFGQNLERSLTRSANLTTFESLCSLLSYLKSSQQVLTVRL